MRNSGDFGVLLEDHEQRQHVDAVGCRTFLTEVSSMFGFDILQISSGYCTSRYVVGAPPPPLPSRGYGPGSVSRSGRFACEERAAGISLTKSWVEPGAGLEAAERRRVSASANNRTAIPSCTDRADPASKI